MKTLQWDMKEVFYFPESVGVPNDARLVKVKAGFTEKRSDDAVRLSGIYHIAAKVDFTDGQRNETIPNDVVFVDDVELDGQTGYFEYAVPLYIDLPPEVEQPLHIEATNVKSTFDGQGSLTVAWNVNCTYGQASADETASKESESKEAVKKENVSKEIVGNEPVTKESISEEGVAMATVNKETASNESAVNKESVDKITANNESADKEPVSQSATNMEVNKESEITEEQMVTAAVPDVNENVVAEKQEEVQKQQTSEPQQTAVVQKQEAAEPVQETQATAMHDSSSWNSQDDILSYIAALPDEWTTSRFRSNDIFVKEES
ncbi:hypothetical protein [Sporosarcina koreensis]|uniref:hypothetical protein n=1 Tax=Sporosarcina koreensis TaxID=334735 RepID=UPI00075CF47D|nr:hypothetical protein [Sporosarcina koreensis]